MLSRMTARSVALSGAMLIALTSLAACGSNEDPESGAAGIESVTFGGKADKEPEVTFDGKLSGAKLETKVLSEGDGAEVAEGDSVLANLWIGNGFSQEKMLSTWDSAPELLTVNDTLSKPLREAVLGQPLGTRVAVLASAKDSFGEAGNSQLGIGNEDAVLWVVQTESKILDGPSEDPAAKRQPAPWAPDLVMTDGVPTGFDWASTDLKPGKNLLDTTLIKGDGPVVKKGQTLYVNYLGQVYQGKKPFDDSFSRGEPASFGIGVGQVVAGWDETLVGRTVGSRVVLRIPPEKGYGKEGNESAGIKGTDTLFFVVDILGAV